MTTATEIARHRRRITPELLHKTGRARFGYVEEIRRSHNPEEMMTVMRELIMTRPTGYADKSKDLPFQIIHFLKECGYTLGEREVEKAAIRRVKKAKVPRRRR